MGLAIAFGGLVAVAMFAFGASLDRGPRSPGHRQLHPRHALPWVAGTMLLVGSVLVATPITSPLVMIGLVLYAGLAAAVVWRMATLDRASAWLPPSRRRARFTVSVIGLTWLGMVLGLLLWIADQVAGFAAGV